MYTFCVYTQIHLADLTELCIVIFQYLFRILGDALPPSKVFDLSAKQNNMNNVSQGIVLSFTAPGDDYDSGTGNHYSR